MTDKKMTKTEIMNLVLDREKTIISEIVLRAPDNLKRYIKERFDVNKKTKGELERIVMLQETYISGLGRPGGPEDSTHKKTRFNSSLSPHEIAEMQKGLQDLADENAKRAEHASMPAAPEIEVRLRDVTNHNAAGAEVSITSDLLGGTLNVRFTHEGIIADLIEDGEVTRTFSNMYDEFVELLR